MAYHVNPETGNVNQCTAKYRCDFNLTEEQHFDDKSEARAASEELMKKVYPSIPNLSKGVSTKLENLSPVEQRKLRTERKKALDLVYELGQSKEGVKLIKLAEDLDRDIAEYDSLTEELNTKNKNITEIEKFLNMSENADKAVAFQSTSPKRVTLSFDRDEYHLFHKYANSDYVDPALMGRSSSMNYHLYRNQNGEEYPGNTYQQGLQDAQTISQMPPSEKRSTKELTQARKELQKFTKDHSEELGTLKQLKVKRSILNNPNNRGEIAQANRSRAKLHAYMKRKKLASMDEFYKHVEEVRENW